MTVRRIIRSINCADSLICHEEIQARIEAATGLQLHAENEGDPVDGYMYIIHQQGNHLIITSIYDTGIHEYVSAQELKAFKLGKPTRELPLLSGAKPPNARTVSTAPTRRAVEDAIDDV